VVGSHHIYAHPAVHAKLSVQSVRGYAKPYQLRQFLEIVQGYDLLPEELL
jgi:hypothetical protein